VGSSNQASPPSTEKDQDRLREAYSVAEQYKNGIHNYTESLFCYYQHWASQYSYQFYAQIFEMKKANDVLQDRQDELLAENALLILELEKSKKAVNEYQQRLRNDTANAQDVQVAGRRRVGKARAKRRGRGNAGLGFLEGADPVRRHQTA
jgi:regulator of replication initiation timing